MFFNFQTPDYVDNCTSVPVHSMCHYLVFPMSWNLNLLAKDNFHHYTFVPVNNPANTRRGGVGLFYKKFSPPYNQE